MASTEIKKTTGRMRSSRPSLNDWKAVTGNEKTAFRLIQGGGENAQASRTYSGDVNVPYALAA